MALVLVVSLSHMASPCLAEIGDSSIRVLSAAVKCRASEGSSGRPAGVVEFIVRDRHPISKPNPHMDPGSHTLVNQLLPQATEPTSGNMKSFAGL